MLNAVDIALMVLLVLAVGLAVRKILRDARGGGCSCGSSSCSGCSGCAISGQCVQGRKKRFAKRH